LPWATSSGNNPGLQPYKYNGKEFVEMHGYDTYDYGARGMYSALMRFTTPDPLAEKYYSISPYAYCGNNPMKYIDPDGKDWVDHKGKIIWIKNVTSANDKDLQKDDKYLGRNVLVGTHNRDANLKEPINSARFDLYLESNHKGPSATIYGNTVPADTKKSGTLAEGLYKAVSGHRNKPQYQNELALRIYNINGTDGLPTVNGNPNPKSDGKTLTGVLFHIGNQHQESLTDSKGHPYSEGCQTSHNGPDAKELHNAFFENIGTNFDGYYYLRGQ